MKHFIFLLISLIFIRNSKHSNTDIEVSKKLKVKCGNPCSVCQNSIYSLKILSKIDCFSTECPDLCSGLRNDFLTQNNLQLSFFRNNEITVCETCFRLNMCHMNDCIQENSIIHNAISNSLENKFLFHKIEKDIPTLNQITRLPSEFSLNFQLIFNNGKRLMEDVRKYLDFFYYSDALRKIYYNFYKKITKENFNLGSNITSTNNWEVFEEFLRKNQNLDRLFQNYLTKMNSLVNLYQTEMTLLKSNLNQEILLSTPSFSQESDSLAKFLEYNNQMTNFIDEIFNFTEMMNFGIQNNLMIINDVKQAFFKNNFSSDSEEPAIVIENNMDTRKGNIKTNLQIQNNTISTPNKNDFIKEKLEKLENRLEQLDLKFVNLTNEIKSPDPVEEIDKISEKRRSLSGRLHEGDGFDDINTKREKYKTKKTIKKIIDEELEKENKREEKEKEKKYRKLLKKTYNMLVDFNKKAPYITSMNSNQTEKIPTVNPIDPKQAQITANITIANVNANLQIKSLNVPPSKTDDGDTLVDTMDFGKLSNILNNNSTIKQSSNVTDTDSERSNESVFENFFLEKKIDKLDKDFINLRKKFNSDFSE